jgi:hypothetical protein
LTYSEVILADQAQKLTDIIDGIIKSFKHDNKILKHIEDMVLASDFSEGLIFF